MLLKSSCEGAGKRCLIWDRKKTWRCTSGRDGLRLVDEFAVACQGFAIVPMPLFWLSSNGWLYPPLNLSNWVSLDLTEWAETAKGTLQDTLFSEEGNAEPVKITVEDWSHRINLKHCLSNIGKTKKRAAPDTSRELLGYSIQLRHFNMVGDDIDVQKTGEIATAEKRLLQNVRGKISWIWRNGEHFQTFYLYIRRNGLWL